ncbi:MAG: MFS transporter [Micrococcaceae bacterium]
MKQYNSNLALLALSLGGLGIGTSEFAVMGLLPQIADGLNITIPQAGHIISAYALGVVAGAPLFAIWTVKWDRTTTLLILMVVFTVGNMLSALSANNYMMLLFRFISGLPHGAYFGIAAVTATRLVDKSKRGHAVSMVMIGLSVANVISVPLITLLGQAVGWRWPFLIIGLLGLITMDAITFSVPRVAAHNAASIAKELSTKESQSTHDVANWHHCLWRIFCRL